MAVSIVDVAHATGVSASTVSRALRGRPGVSEDVRAQIAAVAESLGYTASRSAATLASGRTFTIGVVAPYVSRWFFGTVLDSAEQVFSAAGYDVMLYNLGSHEARNRFFSKMPARKSVDAMLCLLIPTEQEAAALHTLGVPMATTVGGPRPGFTVVGIDDYAGATQAIRHLVNLGHRRIGMIAGASGPQQWTTPIERRRAYLDVLDEAGIDHDTALEADGGFTIAGGERAMTELLAVARPPTAVFAQSDEMAMGALRSLRKHRLKTPDDVSVVGFDNHELADVVGLTTVAQSVTDQGTEAARLLLRQLEEPDSPPPVYTEMPIGLVLRETTAPPRLRGTQ
ncbi:LacI family DNA-binding transcriptional regulator [Streptomyces sp. 3N207]|uniref:LacI family DNA-binding transcriptional regulator n=1 Tax=Streptomyces sp. 3N207 TaxID=3457417 RepID=UPI003FD34792